MRDVVGTVHGNDEGTSEILIRKPEATERKDLFS
jgi:hypothetical protein